MFHTRTGLVSGLVLLFALTAQPMAAHADEQTSPVVQTQAVSPNSAKTKKVYSPEGAFFADVQHETKVKVSEVQAWAKAQTAPQEIVTFVEDVEVATDRLQSSLVPAGRSLKKSLETKVPGVSLAHFIDRTVTVYGLMLIMALALVIFLMGLAKPTSRLGGRH